MWVLLPTPMGPHLQVLLNVLAVIGDTTGCDAGLPHQLKADLATQVVGYISLLQHRVRSGAGKGHCSDSCYPQTPEDRQLTFLFSSTWEKSSSMSAKYLSCKEPSSYVCGPDTPSPFPRHRNSQTQQEPGAPHVHYTHANTHKTHTWAGAPSHAWPQCRPVGPGGGHRPHHPHGSADTLPAPWRLTKS